MTPAPLTDDMLDERLAMLGTPGSGKTYTAKGFVERLLRLGRRVCVIDPLGAWWGLRSSADATGAGFPVVVLGGLHADVLITEEAGASVGAIVAGRDMSCVIDLSELPSDAARAKFMTHFAETIYQKQRGTLLHLVMDEADLFAPQNPQPNETVLLHRINQIVRRGRMRGFIPWLISQRPAVLNKSVLGMIDTMIMMKLVSSQDRAAIGAWIKGQADEEVGKSILSKLPRQKQGQGFIWAPTHNILEQVIFPPITTYDSSRTPQRGEIVDEINLPPIDVSEIAGLLAQTVEPRAAKGKTVPDNDAIEKARAAGYEAGQAADREQIAALQAREHELHAALRSIYRIVAPFIEPLGNPGVIDVIQAKSSIPKQIEAKTALPAGLSGAAAELFAVIARHHPGKFTWHQIAALAGRKATGGSFNSARKALRETGFIAEENDRVVLTDAGRTAGGRTDDVPTDPAGLLALWCEVLPTPAPDILLHLAKLGGCFSEIEQVAAALGRKPIGGSWNSGIAHLRTNELVEFQGKAIRLAPRLRART